MNKIKLYHLNYIDCVFLILSGLRRKSKYKNVITYIAENNKNRVREIFK